MFYLLMILDQKSSGREVYPDMTSKVRNRRKDLTEGSGRQTHINQQ